jgi:hypothetical protein
MAAKRYLFLSTPALYGYKISYGPSHWVTRNQVIVADLPPGRYVMNLVQEGTRRGGWQPVDVVAPETQVSMGENPPAAVTANVTIAGRPGSGGDVTVGLISLDSQSNLPQTAFAKGSAVFDAVPPGRYTPSVYLNRAQAAVVEMKARGAAVAPGLVLTVPETGAVELDLTVDGEAVVLNGKVMCDSGPCAGALAMLVKRTGWELAGPFRFDQSDSDGSFSWKAVPPGEYMMFAFENADPLDYDDPQVIRHLLTGAQALTVRGGDTREIVLALTGTAAK